ncbi:hypothetical protein [Streptomyces sp. NPDC087859]|uniref:hypothetical protein n=1 Tax=Streptomyces sp. NPDC087859 TaxID=3365812 RepID=UPI003815BFBA
MNEDRLRVELGHDQAEGMLAEAHRMLPRLTTRKALAVTLRRPVPSRRPRPAQ